MSDTNVIKLAQPGVFTDSLTEILRSGARALLTQAVEAEIVRWGGGYRTTPDPDPVYLYTDDVIGILPERNLNSGQPSLHAALIGEPHLPPAPCSSSASWSDIGFTSQ